MTQFQQFWMVIFAIAVGYFLGDIHACGRGGCLIHGKDYKVKRRGVGE